MARLAGKAPLARLLTSAAARAALPIAAPLYAGLAIVASILFAPKAMHASEVTSAALGSPWVGLGLFAAWTVTTLPIARAVIQIPSTFMLRALPAPGWCFWALSGVHLLFLEAPWIALWTRGEGAVAGVAAAGSAVAAHGLVLARPLRKREIAIAAVLAAALAIGAPVALLAVSAIAAPIALHAAWRRAPERSGRTWAMPVAGPAPLALAAAHLVGLRRGEPAALVRAAIPVVLGGLAVGPAARGHDLDTAEAASVLSLSIATLTLAIALGGIASAVIRAERRDRWLLDAIGVGGRARVAGAAGATAVAGSVLGAAHGALAARGLAAGGAMALRTVLLGGFLGAALGALAASYARAAQRGGPRHGERALLAFALAVVAAVGAFGALGEIALAPIALLAAAVALASSRSAAGLPEPLSARVAARSQPA